MRAKLQFWLLPLMLAVFLGACTAAPVQPVENPPTSPSQTEAPASSTAESSPTSTATETPSPETPAGPATQTVAVEPAPRLPVGTSLDIAYIHMLDHEKGWAIGGVEGSRDRILYTQDGAQTFSDVTPPVGSGSGSGVEQWALGAFLDHDSALVLYFPAVMEPSPLGGAQVVIWRTDDAGANWSHSPILSTSVLGTQDFPPRLQFINRQEGWFMARNGGAGMHRYPISLYRTRDGGATWDLLIDAIGGSGLQSCRKTGWAFGDSQNGLATIDNCPVDGPAIERTTDGGMTWGRMILSPPEEDPETVSRAYCETYSPQFIDANIVYLAASCTAYENQQVERDLFYSSLDSGQSWVGWDYPGGELLFLDGSHGFALSRELYWTGNGGFTWEFQKTVNWDGQFSFVDADTGWAVARNEGELALVMTNDRGKTWDIIEPVIGP